MILDIEELTFIILEYIGDGGGVGGDGGVPICIISSCISELKSAQYL